MSEPSASPPAASTETGSASQGPPDTRQHMNASFWAAIEARDAVIAGDLERAHANGDFLAHEPFADLPSRWRHWVKQMQVQAAELTMAPDLGQAAAAVSRLALSCGDCHFQMRTGPGGIGRAPGGTAPTEESVEARMLRHERVADDLWSGLVRPSDGDWARGARGLVEASPQRPVQAGEEVDAAFAQKLNEIKAMGLRAVTAKTPRERADVYASYLTRCVDCHQVTPR